MTSASLYRCIPLILVMGGIFFLSHLPGDSLDAPSLPHIDKIAHISLYGLLAATLLYALPKTWHQWHLAQIALLVVLFCLIYGISDEWHQSFIPGRDVSGGDLLADVLGACLTMLLYSQIQKSIQGRKRAEHGGN